MAKPRGRAPDSVLRDKNAQIAMLNQKLKDARGEITNLKQRLTKVHDNLPDPHEINALRNEIASLKRQMAQSKQAAKGREASLRRDLDDALMVISYSMFPDDAEFLSRLGMPILSAYDTYRPIDKTIAHRLKVQVKRLDPVCRYCLDAPSTTVDHIWPQKYGGMHHVHDLVGACETCNATKGHLLPSQLKAAGMTLHLPARLAKAYFPEVFVHRDEA